MCYVIRPMPDQIRSSRIDDDIFFCVSACILRYTHSSILYARHNEIVVEHLWSLPAASDKCFHPWSAQRPVSIE